MIAALNHVRQKKEGKQPEAPPKEKDPMDLFRQQMAIMDSLQKANDPEAKAEAKKQCRCRETCATKARTNIRWPLRHHDIRAQTSTPSNPPKTRASSRSSSTRTSRAMQARASV
jgi:hypothetical protein